MDAAARKHNGHFCCSCSAPGALPGSAVCSRSALPPDLFKHRLMKDQAADRLRHECTCSARHWATMRSFTGATREGPQCGFLVSTEVSDYLALTNL